MNSDYLSRRFSDMAKVARVQMKAKVNSRRLVFDWPKSRSLGFNGSGCSAWPDLTAFRRELRTNTAKFTNVKKIARFGQSRYLIRENMMLVEN